jgi:hypothetical protein
MNIIPQKYNTLIEEIKSTIIEYEFTSRWALVEGYHKVGELIVTSGVSDLTKIAEDVGKSKRTIYRCVQFFKMYPHLNMLPEGKDTSWNRVVTKYLSEERQKPEVVDKNLIKCPNCGFLFNREDLE